jgi:hypothetical protein
MAWRCGILFPDALSGPDFTPPEPLQAIVRTLERRWLQQRAKIA